MIFAGGYPIPAPDVENMPCDHAVSRYVRATYGDGSVRVGVECRQCFTLEHVRLGAKRATKEWGLTEWDIRFLPRRMSEVNPERVVEVRKVLRKQARREWWAWYNGYLNSPYWAAKREAVLERDDYTCCACKGEASQVHHLTYERVGREALEDLVSICAACHAYHHEEWDRRLGRDASYREAAE